MYAAIPAPTRFVASVFLGRYVAMLCSILAYMSYFVQGRLAGRCSTALATSAMDASRK